MANRDKHIGVRVTEAEKAKFEKHIEETREFDSVPRMMRTLATKHIENYDEEEGGLDTDELVNAVDIAISDVHERLDRIEDHIVAIDSATSDDDEIDRLAREIYSGLAVHESADELASMEEVARNATQDAFWLAQTLSTPSAWANYFDATDAEARKACMRMLDYFPDVEFVTEEMGGYNVNFGGDTSGDITVSERRYYKTEDA